jgi:hypothetical protein
MVIFGFGPGKQEDLGEVAPVVCPNCHNQVLLHHVRSKKRFSLYFVPVVPYGTDDYLVCPSAAGVFSSAAHSCRTYGQCPRRPRRSAPDG